MTITREHNRRLDVLYAYAGFPRTVNALGVFMKVLDERKARGIDDPEGGASSPVLATSFRRGWTGNTNDDLPRP